MKEQTDKQKSWWRKHIADDEPLEPQTDWSAAARPDPYLSDFSPVASTTPPGAITKIADRGIEYLRTMIAKSRQRTEVRKAARLAIEEARVERVKDTDLEREGKKYGVLALCFARQERIAVREAFDIAKKFEKKQVFTTPIETMSPFGEDGIKLMHDLRKFKDTMLPPPAPDAF